ncbi:MULTISPECIES: molybdopterin-binding protein [unclassified Beijerinckia]|uniref:competence/damage-inducible protein A n=1 Tax=unclassified Beijerinckia TaxID=2638183 RepID=UPI00089B6A51|nr:MULTISPECIES: molybdopterin-binding protein [unclassified Beijerinckia]MDH7799834.1 molybdenum cofactor synthesis domain-containing protein [Beijerinckia sp. GAS462]SED39185.1 molybdenum cofactor synthesis domain-containing protein [Beijerinckia sp. 28-YEA-48]
MPVAPKTITAAILVIGDEILSGRTKDANIGYIADYMTLIGVDLKEVRVVPDEEDEIVAAVNALRKRYTYLFTTGGIGPTHDDITADSVAKAFGVPIDVDPRAVDLLLTRLKREDLNEARLRMCRVPQGAELIVNAVSAAPGFRVDNVFVMAGVPRIMQAMLDVVGPTLQTGAKMLSETLEAGLPEGAYGAALGEIQKLFPQTSIGSYPHFNTSGGGFSNQIVVRSKDPAILAEAVAAVRVMIEQLIAARGV